MRNMAYPANAAVSDVAIPIQKLCSRCLHLLLYLACSPQRPEKIGPVQLTLGAFAHRAFVSRAQGGGSDLQAIHAQHVPEATTNAHLSISKPEVSILRAEFVDLCDYRIHAAVV